MGKWENNTMRTRRRLTYCFFILFLLSNCSAIKFLKPVKHQIVQSKRFEFENMQVTSGPAVQISSNGQYLEYWSWGTSKLDLSNETIRDTVRLKCLLREDFAGKEHSYFKIKVPYKNGAGEGIYQVNSESWQIYEMEYFDVVPGIWEFSFINDYPQSDTFPKGRNLFADYAIFEWDTTNIIDSIRTDTLYYSDLRLPKSIKATWDRSEAPDLDHYVTFFDSTIFYTSHQAYDSVVTIDTFAVFNTPWLELYACVIAVDTANNRSGFSEMVRGLILQESRHKGDWDNDGKLDFDDLVQFCQSGVYGTLQTHPDYDNIFDFDDSGKVGFEDLIELCRLYGTIFVTNLNISIH